MGVAPEQARLVLPMALVTEWIWTGIAVCLRTYLPGTIGTGRPTRNPRGGGRDSGGDGNGVPRELACHYGGWQRWLNTHRHLGLLANP